MLMAKGAVFSSISSQKNAAMVEGKGWNSNKNQHIA
jgi:hypothetical protein